MHKKILALIVIDQLMKLIFWSESSGVKNYGLAFSINLGLIPNLIVIAAALGYFLFYFRGSLKTVFILAGGISNIIDRVYLGFVRDFWDLGLGFTFNLADVFLLIGILMLISTKNSGLEDEN